MYCFIENLLFHRCYIYFNHRQNVFCTQINTLYIFHNLRGTTHKETRGRPPELAKLTRRLFFLLICLIVLMWLLFVTNHLGAFSDFSSWGSSASFVRYCLLSHFLLMLKQILNVIIQVCFIIFWSILKIINPYMIYI